MTATGARGCAWRAAGAAGAPTAGSGGSSQPAAAGSAAAEFPGLAEQSAVSFINGGGSVRTAPLAPGFEQWFVAGRELAEPDADVDNTTLQLLAGTSARMCPRAALPAE